MYNVILPYRVWIILYGIILRGKIYGGLLRDNTEVYLLCQVKPDCNDIKHMSHNLPPL